jgi:hypothetical protein
VAAGSDGWGVAVYRIDNRAVELGAEVVVRGAGEVGAEVFALLADGEVAAEETVQSIWDILRRGAEAERSGGAGVLADGAADAEVEGVDELAVLLDLLALEADVGDPVLAAGVGAAGDVELDLLIEAGEAILHLGDEPLGEALGLGDGELAELGAGAGDGAAPEGGDIDLEAEGVEGDDQLRGAVVRHVGDEDVLHDGAAELAVAELVGQLRQCSELVAREATAEDAGADGRKAGLALRRNADVVAVDVVGDELGGVDGNVQFVTELVLDSFEHGLSGPAVAHEEVLDAGAGAVFAELGLLAEDADDGFDDGVGLGLLDEGGDADGEVRLGGEAAADAEGVADLLLFFAVVLNRALSGCERNVVDLRVGAPLGAAGDGDLELAREVVELGVGGELAGDLDGERAGVEQLMLVQAGERAAGDVADDIAAGALGTEADCGEGVGDLDQRADGEPVELDVLAGGDVGEVARVPLGDVGDDAELVAGEQAVGQADAHHEELGGFTFTVGSAGDAEAVALGVDAPPLEVEAGPLGEDGVAALAGEFTHLVPCFPGVLGELEALGLLGFGLFRGGGCGLGGHWGSFGLA